METALPSDLADRVHEAGRPLGVDEARAAITRRLIEEKGFTAVEGDWPDCYRVR